MPRRGDTNYLTEDHPNGGNALIAENGSGKDSALFNDMLGSSMGSIEDGNFKAIDRTSFGEVKGDVDSNVDFFTGKPQVSGLGHAFLFRNYRADLGKWQTQDPMGYPDGWNNFAYCNNNTANCFDWLGGETLEGGGSSTFDACSALTAAYNGQPTEYFEKPYGTLDHAYSWTIVINIDYTAKTISLVSAVATTDHAASWRMGSGGFITATSSMKASEAKGVSHKSAVYYVNGVGYYDVTFDVTFGVTITVTSKGDPAKTTEKYISLDASAYATFKE